MELIDFFTGLFFGAFLTLIFDMLKGFLQKIYELKLEELQKRKDVYKDLNKYIATLYSMWDNYKSSTFIYPNFKVDLEKQIREVIDFYTASTQSLKSDLIEKVRKKCSEFLDLVMNSPVGNQWFQSIMRDGDAICNNLKELFLKNSKIGFIRKLLKKTK